MPPFEEAFNALHLEHEFWYIPEMNLNLQDVPTEAVYYNRMSASSHTRDHRYEPELALGILEWLERYSRTVVNGSRALDLEISKIRQYQELEKYKKDTWIINKGTIAGFIVGKNVTSANRKHRFRVVESSPYVSLLSLQRGSKSDIQIGSKIKLCGRI